MSTPSPSSPESDDPLRRAIGEFRMALDHLIDEQIRIWAGRGTAMTPLGTGGREGGASAGVAGDDPLRRLDLLARRLEGRLRQGRTPRPEAMKPGPALEPDGLAGETPTRWRPRS